MWRAYKETERYQYFSVEGHDKDEPKIMWNSDWGEDERQGWEAAGQLHPGSDAGTFQLLWQPWFLLMSKGFALSWASPESSRMLCDGEGYGGNQRCWWLWSWGLREYSGALERKFWSGEGGKGSPLPRRVQMRWSGAKKLQGNLCLVKSPEDGNMKPGPRCRVLAHGGAAMCSHVSRQVRRGPRVLWRRCHVWQSWSNVFRVKHMPDLRRVKGEVSSKKLQVLPAWQESKVLEVLPTKIPQEKKGIKNPVCSHPFTFSSQPVSQVCFSMLTPSSRAFQERSSVSSECSAGTFISSSGLTCKFEW